VPTPLPTAAVRTGTANPDGNLCEAPKLTGQHIHASDHGRLTTLESCIEFLTER
jgi:hypothetical protein